MGISVTNPLAGGILRQGGGYFNPNDPKQVAQLADDATFMRSVEAVVRGCTVIGGGGGGGDDGNSIMSALENGDISALTPQERAEILDSAQTWAGIVRGGYGAKSSFPHNNTTQLIAKYMNNQGYTGPGSKEVLLAVPTAGGGTTNITRGQVLDDEGFSTLVNKVIGDASGTAAPVALGGSRSTLWGQRGRDQFGDMSKWSESERVAYLQKAGSLAKDGSLSPQDEATLMQLAMQNTSSGDDEPSVKLSTGQTISNDDIMEDLTFQRLLRGQGDSSGPSPLSKNSFLAQGDLGDLIGRADYRQLSYAERVDLLNLMSNWKFDPNGIAAERTKIVDVMKGYLVPTPNLEVSVTGGVFSVTVDEGDPGRSLANGTFVSETELSSSTGFDGLIQRTLRHSGAGLPASGLSGGLGLLTMDTSKLDTPEKRFVVLDLIARAASDKTISQAELRNIQATVDRLSNRSSIWV